MKKHLSSLRVQIVLIVLIAWLSPTLILGLTITSVYFPALREKTEAALETRAQNLSIGLNADTQVLIELAKDVTYDGDLASAHSRYRSGLYAYQEFYRVSKNYLERKFGRNPRIEYAAFFPTDAPEQFMFTSAGYPSAMFLQASIQRDLMTLGETLDTRCQFVYRDGLFLLVRNLYSARLERFGMLVLCIDQEAMFGPAAQSAGQWGGHVDIHLGEYASQPGADPSQLAPGLSDRGERLEYVYRLSDRDYALTVVTSQEKRALYADMNQLTLLMAIMVLTLVPIVVLVIYYVHRSVVRPITQLGQAAVDIEQGRLGERVSIKGPNELKQLAGGLTHMSQELSHLVDTVYKEEIALRDAQIQAMQSRINPHFLNNALELINWQARMDGEDQICQMVDALSVLMNAALDRGEGSMAPLREEVVVADAYFYFLERRFGDKVALTKRIDRALEDALIPRLVIQTLLENAAEHGIAPAGGGHIELIVRREGEALVVQAVNDGKRPTEETLKNVARIISGEQVTAHVGLANVSERLRLIYMGRASVRLYLNEKGDTVAEVRLPIG